MRIRQTLTIKKEIGSAGRFSTTFLVSSQISIFRESEQSGKLDRLDGEDTCIQEWTQNGLSRVKRLGAV